MKVPAVFRKSCRGFSAKRLFLVPGGFHEADGRKEGMAVMEGIDDAVVCAAGCDYVVFVAFGTGNGLLAYAARFKDSYRRFRQKFVSCVTIEYGPYGRETEPPI